MIIFPAIDLYEKKAVRLFKGDYSQMTIYNDNPASVALDFVSAGADHIHVVDLEGARFGNTPNLDVILEIKSKSDSFVEVGGGIRSMEVVDRYLSAGIDRVIIGTAAVEDEAFLKSAIEKHGEKIAVSADLKDGFVALRGWVEKSQIEAFEFFESMQKMGIKYMICTDISKDGAMKGTNLELYRSLSKEFNMNITASGGVSTIEDVAELRKMDMYAAIIGKAYYTKALDLKEALEVSK